MKYFFPVLMVVSAAVAFAGGITHLVNKAPYNIPCLTDGGVPVTVSQGRYAMNVVTTDSWVCYTAACNDGGVLRGVSWSEDWNQPTAVDGGIPFNCRSADGTGVVSLAPISE